MPRRVFLVGLRNSIVVGEYLLNAAGKEDSMESSRAIGIGVITFAFLINGVHVKTGLFLGNFSGLFQNCDCHFYQYHRLGCVEFGASDDFRGETQCL